MRIEEPASVKDLLRVARREVRVLARRDCHVRVYRQMGAVRLGSSYGGWTVLPQLISSDSVVFGVGVGHDVTWDLAMIARFGCRVHAFDPTPRSLEYVRSLRNTPKEFVFHPYGLAGGDGQTTFVMRNEHPEWSSFNMSSEVDGSYEVVTLDVRRLGTLMDICGCSHLDVLKMDIEGAEYEVLADMARSGIHPDQLCIEFHFLGDERRSLADFRSALKLLRRLNYLAIDRSPNGKEFTFLRKELLNRTGSAAPV